MHQPDGFNLFRGPPRAVVAIGWAWLGSFLPAYVCCMLWVYSAGKFYGAHSAQVARIAGVFRLKNFALATVLMFAVRKWFVLPNLIGVSHALSGFQFALLVVDVLAVMAWGYAVNDRADRAEDSLNRPDRAAIGYGTRPIFFWRMATLLVAVMLVCTAYLAHSEGRWFHVWVLPFALGGLWAYARWFKKSGFAGNLLVSAMVAAVPWLVLWAECQSCLLSDVSPNLREPLLVFSVQLFCLSLARELVKDAQDAEGDRQAGVRSLALVLGQSFVRWMCSGLVVLSAALVFWLQPVNKIAVALVAVMLISGVLAYGAARGAWSMSRISSWLKWFLLLYTTFFLLSRGG